MANYLQRVITAGARVRSPAKPPVGAPAILPAAFVPPLASPVPAASSPRSTKPAPPPIPEPAVAPAQKIATDPPAAQALPPLTHRPAVPLSVALARLASGPPIRAPKGIRAEVGPPQPPRAELPRMETPMPLKPTEPAPEPAVVHQRAEPHAPTPAPRIESPTPDADVLIALVPAPPLAPPQDVQVAEAKPEPKVPVQKKSSRKPPEPNPVAPPIRQPQAEPPAQAIEPTSVRATPPIEVKPVTAQSNPKIEPVRIQPKLSEQPPTPAIAPERADTRRGRITIGHVDVQVNNQRAAPTTPQAAATPGPRTDFFEARYLNRFSMRP